MEGLRFNTAIAKLIELNNHLTKRGAVPREVAEALVLLVAPLAPHIAEELWSRLGHDGSLAYEPFPRADPALLVEDDRDLRRAGRGQGARPAGGPADVDRGRAAEQALASEAVQRALDGREVRKVIVRAPKLVNVVPA